MTKKLLIGIFISFILNALANLKADKNVTKTNINALLEINNDSLGILISRISLVYKYSFVPIKSHVAGMLIYNTATNVVLTNNVIPRFYYKEQNGVRVLWQNCTNSYKNYTGTTNIN